MFILYISIREGDFLNRSYVDYLLDGEDINSQLKTIFFYENDHAIFAEIKRLDVDRNTSPEKRLFCFFYDRDERRLERLDFVSMSVQDNLVERVFKQGTLKSSKEEAFFENKDGEISKFVNRKFMPDDFKVSVLKFLKL